MSNNLCLPNFVEKHLNDRYFIKKAGFGFGAIDGNFYALNNYNVLFAKKSILLPTYISKSVLYSTQFLTLNNPS